LGIHFTAWRGAKCEGNCSGTQHRHQRSAAVGGGQQPAGFVNQRHFEALQQRTDPAHQCTVQGHQGNRCLARVERLYNRRRSGLGLGFKVFAQGACECGQRQGIGQRPIFSGV
jgi:hypothetical protein